jgi:hypothetical protein
MTVRESASRFRVSALESAAVVGDLIRFRIRLGPQKLSAAFLLKHVEGGRSQPEQEKRAESRIVAGTISVDARCPI